MAEGAFAQLQDDDFFFRLHSEQCSIYAYMKHLAGNMRSRFTDFLTSDGEKPDRDRESEFAEERVPREQIMAMWEEGWRIVFTALESLKPGDLERTVTIRNEPHSVILAITRQVAHYMFGDYVLLTAHSENFWNGLDRQGVYWTVFRHFARDLEEMRMEEAGAMKQLRF